MNKSYRNLETARDVPPVDRRRTDTRERMIRAAIDLYREHGMGGTGFTDVLDATGAARGAIYHHFPGGKDELAAEVVATSGRDLLHFVERLLEKHTPGDAIRRFSAWFAEQLERTDMAFGCPIAPPVLEAALESDAIAGASATAFDAWRDELSRALRGEGVPSARARALGETVFAGLEGALILCRAHRSSRPIRDVGAELARLLDDAVAAHRR